VAARGQAALLPRSVLGGGTTQRGGDAGMAQRGRDVGVGPWLCEAVARCRRRIEQGAAQVSAWALGCVPCRAW